MARALVDIRTRKIIVPFRAAALDVLGKPWLNVAVVENPQFGERFMVRMATTTERHPYESNAMPRLKIGSKVAIKQDRLIWQVVGTKFGCAILIHERSRQTIIVQRSDITFIAGVVC